MQSKIPANRASTPGRGEAPRRRPRTGAPASQPPRADDRPGADPPESERVFQATFDRAAIGIAHISAEGRWLRVNQRLCDLLGYSHAELAALTWQDLTHPDDLDVDLDHVRRLLAGDIDEYAMDKRYVRKDGGLVWGHLTVALVRTPDGAPDYFISMVQDITARKRLEQERAQLQALTDTALSPLALDDLLHELAGRVLAVLGVDSVGIFLLDEDGETLTVRAARGLLEEDVGRVRVAAGQGFPGRVASRRAPLIVDDLAPFEPVLPKIREHVRSAAGVPLLVEDHMAAGQATVDRGEARLVGVLGVGSATPHRFTKADVQLLKLVGDRIALAVDRARLYAAEQDARRRAEAEAARAQASEAEAAARAAQLHTILETIVDGVAVSGTDGRLITTNRAFRELLAADHLPAFDAMSFAERAPLLDYLYAATGEPLPTERHPVARALRGEVVTGPGAEIRMRALDGRDLDANISAAPLRAGDGRVVGAVSVLRDTTWRKRLEREREAALARAERQAEQLDRIFEAAADGLIVYDVQGRIVRENPATRHIFALDAAPPGYRQLPARERLARYAPRDEQGRPVAVAEMPLMRALRGEVVTGPEAEKGSETGSGPDVRDLRMRALDGREIEIHNAVAPLHDREGHLVGAVNVLHDMTERNRLARERAAARADELAAREVSRRMEQFLAVAAHDLRAPLTAVVGFLALAERQAERLADAAREESSALAPQIATVRDRLEEADRGAERLTRLLTRLFDTAAIRAGRLELRRAPCDLAALVREQVAGLRAAAPERVIQLREPAGGEPIPVEADADRLGQVVANYVTNALKYCPPDQSVDVDVSVAVCEAGEGEERGEGQARVARVAVRDRGPGLPEAERGRVWELFHRVPGVEAQGAASGGVASGSLGLGLHICKAIVEAHGGRVGVASAVGEGSTFWFTLPLLPLLPLAGPRSHPAGAGP